MIAGCLNDMARYFTQHHAGFILGAENERADVE